MATVPHLPATTSDAAVGRAAIIGGAIGFVGVTAGVWLMGLVSGVDALPALALGVFVGSWGGLGFGAMLAASIVGNRSM